MSRDVVEKVEGFEIDPPFKQSKTNVELRSGTKKGEKVKRKKECSVSRSNRQTEVVFKSAPLQSRLMIRRCFTELNGVAA